jgi:hypothetical protein
MLSLRSVLGARTLMMEGVTIINGTIRGSIVFENQNERRLHMVFFERFSGWLVCLLASWSVCASLPAAAPSVLRGAIQTLANEPLAGTITAVHLSVPGKMSVSTFFTNSSGRFEFQISEGDWIIVAKADEYISEAKSVAIDAQSEMLDLVFRLPLAQRVTGVVLDKDGRSVPGASVRIVYPFLRHRFNYGEDTAEVLEANRLGRFTVAKVVEGQAFQLCAWSNDHLPACTESSTLVSNDTLDRIVVVGDLGQIVRGRILDGYGAAVVGAVVRLRTFSEVLDITIRRLRGVEQTQATGFDGWFEFRGIAEGPFVLEVGGNFGSRVFRGRVEKGQNSEVHLRLDY